MKKGKLKIAFAVCVIALCGWLIVRMIGWARGLLAVGAGALDDLLDRPYPEETEPVPEETDPNELIQDLFGEDSYNGEGVSVPE